jgi:hypothetical protein
MGKNTADGLTKNANELTRLAGKSYADYWQYMKQVDALQNGKAVGWSGEKIARLKDRAAEAKALTEDLQQQAVSVRQKAMEMAGTDNSAYAQGLIDKFRDARVALAKNHDVESALIEGGGKVDATAIARMFQRGDKMTGELKTIGAFANNFRNIAKPLSGTPDAHNLRSVASLLLASGGGAMGGFPGMALGAIPMAAGPASRSIMFSQAVQRGLLAPQTVSPAARMGSGLLGYAPIGGTVLGLNALNQ